MEETGLENGNGNAIGAEGEGDGTFNMATMQKCLSSFIDSGSIESHRYYLSRKTVLEMLRERGYSVLTSEIDLSLDEFREIHGHTPDTDRLKISAAHKSDPSKRILVIFCGPGAVKVGTIRGIASQIANKESLTSLILILEKQITSQAQKALDLFSFKIEMFQPIMKCVQEVPKTTAFAVYLPSITDLLVNITKHALKPKHQILTETEKQKLLKSYNIEDKQLPRILKKDAIARYYGLEKGQVVKVTYNGDITESHVTYRCVW